MKNKMQSAMIKLSHSLCSFFQIFSFCVLFSLIQKRLYTVMKDTTVLNVSISDVSACQISFVILFLFCCRTRGSLSFHWSRERLRKPQNGTQIDLLSDMPGQIHHRKRFFGGFIQGKATFLDIFSFCMCIFFKALVSVICYIPYCVTPLLSFWSCCD